MDAAPRVIRVHIMPGDYDKPMGGVGEPGRAADPARLVQTRFSRRQARESAASRIRDQLKV